MAAISKFEFCDSCVNFDIDYECRSCREGSRFEATDLVQELSVHELLFMINPTKNDDE